MTWSLGSPGARRVSTGSADDVSRLGPGDVRTTWEQALAKTPGHLVTQTPQWLSAILDGSGWHDRTRIYERPQGRSLVLPLVGRGAGRVAVGRSWPHGWGSGGVLASDGRVTTEDLAVVTEDLRAGAAARVIVHPHPLQSGWDDLGTGSHLHSRYLTHVLDLSSGRAGVWAGYSKNVRRSIRRAESSGVEVVRDDQGALLPTFATLYGLSMLRWAQAKGRSTTVARLHGRVEEPRRRLQSIAAALGIGNGAIFGLVGRRAPAGQVGSVTGLVGAAGGLGGFLPPIIMGLVVQATGSYAIGLMLLSDVAFAGAIYAAWRLRDVRLPAEPLA